MSDHASTIAIAAVALVLIGFSQTAGDSRTFAARHRYRIDINQESVAQGMANVGAGLFQGMPVSTSLSASSLNDHSGARTGLASLTSGVIVLLTLVVLAPLFSKLPKPVLAALIIEAVVMGMMDVPEMRRLFRVQRFDFWIAMAAIVATLLFGVLAGVMIGIGLSLIWLISVATRPPMPLLGREPGTQVFRELDEHPGDEQFPGIVVLRLDGGLFFATSDALEDRVREVALSTPGITGIVLDCEGIDFIDSQGSAKMGEILELTEQAGVTLRLARVKPAVREVLGRDGVLDRIGDRPDSRERRSGRGGPDSRRRRHPCGRLISPRRGGQSSCDASQSASWKVSRKAATPMHMSSSAASAVTIPTWTTATSPLNIRESAGRTRSRTASRRTGSTSGFGAGSSRFPRQPRRGDQNDPRTLRQIFRDRPELAVSYEGR